MLDSELKVMEILWKKSPMKASDLFKILNDEYGWKQGTAYAAIHKCIDKKYIERKDPCFWCYPIISKRKAQTEAIKDLFFGRLFKNKSQSNITSASFVNSDCLTKEDINEIRKLIEDFQKKN